MSFEQFNLSEHILKALKEKNYSEPTPIQEKAIPLVLKRHDLMGCAQTGTGKTAAFAIPIIQLIEKKDQHHKGKPVMRALIVTPTRELAIQIEESFKDYGKHTFLRYAVVFGGVNQSRQVEQIKRGVNVLVATPGRLLDLINQGYISLNDVKLFVLDEADRMLDMGFIHDINKLLALLPEQRQSLFFSATMPPNIVKLASKILKNPKRVEVTPASSTAETIEQRIYMTNKSSKKDLLLHILTKEVEASALVFTRTKHGADRVARLLNRNNVKAAAIHGDKAQNARQKALSLFKERKLQVLVATDIAARGIDIDKLRYVINYEIPNIAETYVHRIGRSGRAGEDGMALSLCDAEERVFVRDIERLIGLKIPQIEDHPFPQTDKPMTPAEKKQFEKEKQERKRAFIEAKRNRGGGRGGRNSRGNDNPRGKREEKDNNRNSRDRSESRGRKEEQGSKRNAPEKADNRREGENKDRNSRRDDKNRDKGANASKGKNQSSRKPKGDDKKKSDDKPRRGGKTRKKLPESLSNKYRWPLE